ncbi:hypothetical protein, partial [Klebsiella pneumoniae]|uniref:hypothetical protein n=1 Tax=Klebsiella pneumoniae TaxID=573 RepID=UPI003EBB266A
MRAVEMDMLRSVCGVRRIDRVRNEEIRGRCGVDKSLNQQVEESILRWYGHVERMDDERTVKKIYKSDIVGRRRRGRPRRRWYDVV